MNFQQLKQLIQNNLIYGENGRHVDRRGITTTLVEPDYSRIWGIDISGRWDGIVNLSVTKSKGASFVFIKGVDGTLNTPYYAENYNNAKAANLACAPYAWLYRDVNVNCRAQAQALHALNQKHPPQLPSVIDFESTKFGGTQSNPNFSDLDKWVTEWLRLGNPKPLLYSGKYFMDQYGRIPESLKDKLAGLFIAAYTSGNPNMPLGWTEWKYHQFTPEGDALLLAPGNQGKIELDLDYRGTATKPTEPPNGGTMYKKAMGNISMRTGPGVGFPKAQINGVDQYVLTGDIIEVNQIQNGFAEIKILYRNDVIIATPPVAWSGMAYLVDTTYTPPQIPAGKPETVDIVLTAGSTITVKDAAGNVIWSGTA